MEGQVGFYLWRHQDRAQNVAICRSRECLSACAQLSGRFGSVALIRSSCLCVYTHVHRYEYIIMGNVLV